MLQAIGLAKNNCRCVAPNIPESTDLSAFVVRYWADAAIAARFRHFALEVGALDRGVETLVRGRGILALDRVRADLPDLRRVPGALLGIEHDAISGFDVLEIVGDLDRQLNTDRGQAVAAMLPPRKEMQLEIQGRQRSPFPLLRLCALD